MKLPKIEQCLCYDEKTGSTHLVTTGATINYTHYLTTSVITENYKVTDTTLRKKYTSIGVQNKDYFYSDNKVLISEGFLNKINLKKKHKANNSILVDNSLKIPYTKALNIKNDLMQDLVTNNFQEYLKRCIVKEVKEMHWDSFITIATGSFMSQDDWDVAMMKFIDLLSIELGSKDVSAVYSTERSINIRASVITKYDSLHRHVHLLLNKSNKRISDLRIKKIFLRAINKRSFRRYEYYSKLFQKNMFGENYILKTYNQETDCFSLVAPQKNLNS